MKAGNSASIFKHSSDVIAESALTVANGFGFFRSAHVGWLVANADKGTKAALWATKGSRLLSIGMRINLIGLVVSAAQLGITACYNRYSLSQYMQWIKSSQWGNEPKGMSLSQSNEQLAKISSKPVLSIIPLSRGKALSLSIPGITISELDEAGIEVSIYWLVNHRENKCEPWTEEIGQQWVVLSSPEEPLTIGVPIYEIESNAQHGVAIELHYFPTPDSNEKVVVRYQTINLNKGGLLSEVSMLKVKELVSGNLQPLNTNQLNMQGV